MRKTYKTVTRCSLVSRWKIFLASMATTATKSNPVFRCSSTLPGKLSSYAFDITPREITRILEEAVEHVCQGRTFGSRKSRTAILNCKVFTDFRVRCRKTDDNWPTRFILLRGPPSARGNSALGIEISRCSCRFFFGKNNFVASATAVTATACLQRFPFASRSCFHSSSRISTVCDVRTRLPVNCRAPIGDQRGSASFVSFCSFFVQRGDRRISQSLSPLLHVSVHSILLTSSIWICRRARDGYVSTLERRSDETRFEVSVRSLIGFPIGVFENGSTRIDSKNMEKKINTRTDADRFELLNRFICSSVYDFGTHSDRKKGNVLFRNLASQSFVSRR